MIVHVINVVQSETVNKIGILLMKPTLRTIIKCLFNFIFTVILPYLIIFGMMTALLFMGHVGVHSLTEDINLGDSLDDYLQKDNKNYVVLIKSRDTDNLIQMWSGRDDIFDYSYAIKLQTFRIFNPVCFCLFDENKQVIDVVCGDG